MSHGSRTDVLVLIRGWNKFKQRPDGLMVGYCTHTLVFASPSMVHAKYGSNLDGSRYGC